MICDVSMWLVEVSSVFFGEIVEESGLFAGIMHVGAGKDRYVVC